MMGRSELNKRRCQDFTSYPKQEVVAMDTTMDAALAQAISEGRAHPRTHAPLTLPELSEATVHYISTLPNIVSRLADAQSAIRAPPPVTFKVRGTETRAR